LVLVKPLERSTQATGSREETDSLRDETILGTQGVAASGDVGGGRE
jgi:hypothetical protein